MAFAESPPQPPPPEVIAADPAALYTYLVQLLDYLERLRAAIP
jgi:hypothetical protein